MQRVFVEFVAVGYLYDMPQVHHRYAVAYVPHNRKVVRYEQVGQAELVLQILKQVDDLRLNGHIQRRNRLVANDEAGIDRKRARDADALPLPAAEFVRIAVRHIRVQAHGLQQFGNALAVFGFG